VAQTEPSLDSRRETLDVNGGSAGQISFFLAIPGRFIGRLLRHRRFINLSIFRIAEAGENAHYNLLPDPDSV
jgi:hypothetical protein